MVIHMRDHFIKTKKSLVSSEQDKSHFPLFNPSKSFSPCLILKVSQLRCLPRYFPLYRIEKDVLDVYVSKWILREEKWIL